MGARVILARGSLSARGHIAWREAEQAGIGFDEPVKTALWVAKVGHQGQQRVDEIVRAIKRSDTLPRTAHLDGEPSLLELGDTVENICERLATIPEIAGPFGDELMKLDAVAQSLRRMFANRKS